MKEVCVINKSPNEFKDAYSGIEYAFVPGKKVHIPLRAAVHIFGYGQKDMTPYYRRIGATDPVKGKMFFDNFSLEEVTYVRQDDAVELESLRIQMEEKDEEIKALQEKLSAAETENAQLQKKCDKLEKKLEK